MFKGHSWHGACAGYSSKDRSYSLVSLETTLLPIYLLGQKSLSSFANSSEDTSPWTSHRPGVFHGSVGFPSCKTSFHYCFGKDLDHWPSGWQFRGLTLPSLEACPILGGVERDEGNFTVIHVLEVIVKTVILVMQEISYGILCPDL